MKYVKIRSWHFTDFDSRGGLHHTLCGRWAPRANELIDALPWEEKSCETCLKKNERDENRVSQ